MRMVHLAARLMREINQIEKREKSIENAEAELNVQKDIEVDRKHPRNVKDFG
jgi:hypothetical protein